MHSKKNRIHYRPLEKPLLDVFLIVLIWTIIAILAFSFGPKPITFNPEPPKVVAPSPSPAVLMTEVVPYQTPEPTKSPRYGFTEDDIYLMAVLLTGSKDVGGDGEFDFDFGRQDDYAQISLVLCVVMNRVRSDLYPDTVSEVIWQKRQFSYMYKWKNGLPSVSDISLQRVTEWCNAYDAYDLGVQSIPEDHLYFSGDGINNYSR